jgi:HKD family nuclease
MKQAQILTNSTHRNHLTKVLEFLEDADEVWFATAFLKMSGLLLLLPAIKGHIGKNKKIRIITGQNFGLTEPDAFSELHRLFDKRRSAKLYLDKAGLKTKIFHPKLFMFKTGSDVKIISGSANITKGGLCDNQEFSVCFETSITNLDFIEVVDYFDLITSIEHAEEVTLAAINRYKQYFDQQKDARKDQKAVPDKSTDEYDFDYTKLRKRLKTYDRKNFDIESKHRAEDYRIAKDLLDEIVTSTRLTQTRFAEIIDDLVGRKGQHGLWRSGSLLRLRLNVHKCQSEFKDLVKFIKKNQQQEAGKIFINAKKYVEKVKGARMNYVAEIMMTYQPDRFANLNSNPISVLKEEAGVYYKSHSDSYTAEDYQQYCGVIQEICKELGLKNMLEADSFINDIYWELKKIN